MPAQPGEGDLTNRKKSYSEEQGMSEASAEARPLDIEVAAKRYEDGMRSFKDDLYSEATGRQKNYEFTGFSMHEAGSLLYEDGTEEIREAIQGMIGKTVKDMDRLLSRERRVRQEQYRLLSKSRLLRALNNFAASMQERYPGQPEAEKFKTIMDVAQQEAMELVEIEARVSNLERYGEIQEVGEPISREDDPVTEKQLALVQCMGGPRLIYKDGKLSATTPYLAKAEGKNSLHFTLNHMVEPHAQGTWEGSEGMVISPMQDMSPDNRRPYAFNEIDVFYYNTEVELSPRSLLIVDGESERWSKFLAENPEIEEQFIVLKLKDKKGMRAAATLALEKMGFSCIQGGDFGSDDKLVSDKIDKFAETSGISPETRPHFFTTAETVDEMFEMSAGLRRYRQQGAGDWMERIDWEDVGNYPRFLRDADTKINLLMNQAYRGSTLEDLNIGDEQRAELLRDMLSVLDDFGADDLKQRREAYKAALTDRTGGDVLKERAFGNRQMFSRGLVNRVYEIRRQAAELEKSGEDPARLARLRAGIRFLEGQAHAGARKKLDAWQERDRLGYLMDRHNFQEDFST